MTYHLYNGAKDVANSNSNMQFYASLAFTKYFRGNIS